MGLKRQNAIAKRHVEKLLYGLSITTELDLKSMDLESIHHLRSFLALAIARLNQDICRRAKES